MTWGSLDLSYGKDNFVHTMCLNGETLSHLMGKLAANDQIKRRFMFMKKKIWPKGLWSYIMFMFIIFKLLLWNHLANRSQIYMDPPWNRETKICKNGLSHMIDDC